MITSFPAGKPSLYPQCLFSLLTFSQRSFELSVTIIGIFRIYGLYGRRESGPFLFTLLSGVETREEQLYIIQQTTNLF